MYDLYTEAKEIAQEAINDGIEQGYDGELLRNHAEEMIFQTCDGHEDVIYYHNALKFCAEQNTLAGEDWIDSCYGSLAREGDSLGAIASRVTFATLYVAASEQLERLFND